MKPDWDQLGAEYASSSSVVIADVDCTVEQDLCSDYDVRGYPTIKYFTAETPEKGADYSGGRSFDDLKKFVEEELEVKCLVEDPSGCSEKEVRWAELRASHLYAWVWNIRAVGVADGTTHGGSQDLCP